MYILLAATQRKVIAELSSVPSGAQHRRRFLGVHPAQERNIANFYQRFLQLKVEAPEVSNDQIITQGIKALRVGPFTVI
jgi:hypothetical protein